MTTNVVDTAASLLASDSRWSFPPIKTALGAVHAVLYVDDTDFDKIELGHDVSFIFAGSAMLIARWKNWYRDPGKSVKNRPPVETDFAFCMIDMQTRQVAMEHGQKIVGSDHRFAGTGAWGAYDCWKINKDARRAVKSAYAVDIQSGGVVRSLDLKTGKHNLGSSDSYKSINQVAERKGVVMYPSKEVPAAEAALVDPFVADALKKVAAGEMSAHAPAGKDPIVWTDADVKRLDDALEKYFGKK